MFLANRPFEETHIGGWMDGWMGHCRPTFVELLGHVRGIQMSTGLDWGEVYGM